MNGYTYTRVWLVGHKLVIADTLVEAVRLFKLYMGDDYHDEPEKVEAVPASSCGVCKDYDAIIVSQDTIEKDK